VIVLHRHHLPLAIENEQTCLFSRAMAVHYHHYGKPEGRASISACFQIINPVLPFNIDSALTVRDKTLPMVSLYVKIVE